MIEIEIFRLRRREVDRERNDRGRERATRER
jgi:hypothetical protein